MNYIVEIDPCSLDVCMIFAKQTEWYSALFKHNRVPFDFDAEYIPQENKEKFVCKIDEYWVLTCKGIKIPLHDRDHTRLFIFTDMGRYYIHIFCDCVIPENPDEFTKSFRIMPGFSHIDIEIPVTDANIILMQSQKKPKFTLRTKEGKKIYESS